MSLLNTNFDKNSFNSLNQGLQLISERKNCKKRIREGFIEGVENMDDSDAASAPSTGNASSSNDFQAPSGTDQAEWMAEQMAEYGLKSDGSQMESSDDSVTANVNNRNLALVNKLRSDFTKQKLDYGNILKDYSSNTITFFNDISGAEAEVEKCKATCETYNEYLIDAGDTEDVKLRKRKQKDACKAGCHFQLPVVLDCEQHELFKGAKYQGSDVTCGTESIKTICRNTHDYDKGAAAQTTASKIIDASGISVFDGCCECNLGKQYEPQYVLNGNTYTNCNDFSNEHGERDACEQASSLIEKNYSIKPFKTNYQELTNKNSELITKSNAILKIVNDLKKLNVDIVSDNKTNQERFRRNTIKFEKIKDDIKLKSDNKKVDTLNKLVKDKYSLKKSSDLQLYFWIILALGFGISALMKIKQI